MKVLFQSWIQVQHSYGIVMCFILKHLQQNYKGKIIIYVQEMPYFNPKWNDSKKCVYNKEYTDILSELKQYNGEQVDLVWSQTYPYDITRISNDIPKCVFYTSEFSKLDTSFFNISNVKMYDDEYIKDYLAKNDNIYFTSPSKWSSNGLIPYSKRDRIITHGVDTDIFYKHTDDTIRNKIRKKYGISETDILMINIGAMTGNKGIILILESLNYLVNKMGKCQYKLLLKGSGDLYTSQQFLENDMNRLQCTNEELVKLHKHIIFINDTLSFDRINDLYNAADIYVSPYLCEGFNLTPLEALSAGLDVLVPQTGSTKEYIQSIYENSGKNYIHYVKSHVIENPMGYQNHINVNDVINALINFKKGNDGYLQMVNYIKEALSWNAVSHLVFNYMNEIVQLNNKKKMNV